MQIQPINIVAIFTHKNVLDILFVLIYPLKLFGLNAQIKFTSLEYYKCLIIFKLYQKKYNKIVTNNSENLFKITICVKKSQ